MINRSKFALTFGIFGALMHFLWSIVVGLRFAQGIINFVYGMHFLSNPFTVAAFTLGNALMLTVLGFIIPYIIATIFATLWNKVHKA